MLKWTIIEHTLTSTDEKLTSVMAVTSNESCGASSGGMLPSGSEMADMDVNEVFRERSTGGSVERG